MHKVVTVTRPLDEGLKAIKGTETTGHVFLDGQWRKVLSEDMYAAYRFTFLRLRTVLQIVGHLARFRL